MDGPRIWTFGFRDTIATYRDEVRGGVTYSTMIATRPRTPEDPPFEPVRGTWKRGGTAHILTPAPWGCPECGPSNVCEAGGCDVDTCPRLDEVPPCCVCGV
jgi:hypothetical protein